MVVVVTATRLSRAAFADTPLGKSLRRLSVDNTLETAVVEFNQAGLPSVYNRFIDESLREHLLVFVHDDVWLEDLFFSERIRNALDRFDVAGLAGNRRLLPDSPAWFAKNDQLELDKENLSGVVSQGPHPFGNPVIYGPTPAPVQLIDGLLIAARTSALLDARVRFDERFDFHFYDLDFARQANAAGLKVGTWPLAVTHTSWGNYDERWRRGLALYREKWAAAASAGTSLASA